MRTEMDPSMLDNIFNEPLRGHLTDIRQGNNVKSVSRHFMSNNHMADDLNAIIVVQITDNVNIRFTTEEWWISLLQRKFPWGQNLFS